MKDETFTITGPGYYRMRNGSKARVLCTDAPGAYPCVGWFYEGVDCRSVQPLTWKPTGFFHLGEGGHDRDIIAPWEDAPKMRKIELRRALMRVGGEYYISTPSNSEFVGGSRFIRWIDEPPMIVEVEDEK